MQKTKYHPSWDTLRVPAKNHVFKTGDIVKYHKLLGQVFQMMPVARSQSNSHQILMIQQFQMGIDGGDDNGDQGDFRKTQTF